MPTYMVLAQVDEREFQNPQELVAIWGEIRNDVEQLGGELLDSHALMGEHDFLIQYEVPDDDDAIQISMAIEGHGLDTQSMRAITTERLGELVDDL